MPITGFKCCRECAETKDLIHFSFRPDSKDGYRNDCKVCVALRTKAYNIKNPEKVKETQRNCYLKNKDAYKAKSREYKQKDPLKTKLRDAEKSSKCDKTKRNEYAREYRKNNPKKVLALYHAYRNKKASKLSKPFFAEIKTIYLNCPENCVVDHIIPISNEFITGLHVPWNLQYLSRDDNYIKSNKFDGTYQNEGWKQCR